MTNGTLYLVFKSSKKKSTWQIYYILYFMKITSCSFDFISTGETEQILLINVTFTVTV